MADLTYNIESRLLTSKIENAHISAYAGSGGRAGSKVRGAENWWLANNSLATHIGGAKSTGTHFFGPIPRGLYTLRLHESETNWIRLLPDKGNVMYGRSAFLIHGRGKTGSHGCLVPTDFNVVKHLCKLVTEREKAGKPLVSLEVVSIGTDIGKQHYTA